RVVAHAGVVDLRRVHQLALGPDVQDVHAQTGEVAADVGHVAGAAREPDVAPPEEDRDHDAVIRGVGGTVVGVVVQDDVARLVGAGQPAVDAADVGRYGSAVHRRRVRFAQFTAVDVED